MTNRSILPSVFWDKGVISLVALVWHSIGSFCGGGGTVAYLAIKDTMPYPMDSSRNVKRYLKNYPHLFDYGQTIFCLSFPSRDRATAPGRYEQFYFTKNVPYPQKIHFEDAIRSEDPPL